MLKKTNSANERLFQVPSTRTKSWRSFISRKYFFYKLKCIPSICTFADEICNMLSFTRADLLPTVSVVNVCRDVALNHHGNVVAAVPHHQDCTCHGNRHQIWSNNFVMVEAGLNVHIWINNSNWLFCWLERRIMWMLTHYFVNTVELMTIKILVFISTIFIRTIAMDCSY